MTEWIAWTKCRTCDYMAKDVFERPEDELDATPQVRCPKCGGPAKYITFPVFEVQTFELPSPSAMYDTIDDW